MRDMIVALHELPGLDEALSKARERGVVVRRVLPTETPEVEDWARQHFADWVPEIVASFARQPIACFVALEAEGIVGFAAYDATFPNFFGPTGVLPECRGRGIGRTLLLAALHAQRGQGYAYSIIGGVGPVEFYTKTVGAQLLEGPAALLRAQR